MAEFCESPKDAMHGEKEGSIRGSGRFNSQDARTPDRVYSERFWVLLLFSLCTCINACGWICFGPIFSLIEYVYSVNLLTVNYLSMSFMMFFLPLNFPSVIALDKYGLRVGVIIGITGTSLGLWLRCLI